MVLLTLNEERNIRACLRSLANQTTHEFEVIVIDAASTDNTVAIIKEVQPTFPVPLRLETSNRVLPIGEARNLGVHLSRAPLVAFVSADAELGPGWITLALRALDDADMVFGRQVHEPNEWTLGAAVRGLRYHFPTTRAEDPLRFASNVAAAYKKEILEAFPFDPWANAAEDLLLAKRAHAAGYEAVYDPLMVVAHHDVASSRQEFRKSIREGEGWGLYRSELGVFMPVLAWGSALVAAIAFLAWRPGPVAFLLFAFVLWVPALRRALLRRRALPPRWLAKAVAASPVFDLAFLLYYIRGLFGRPSRKNAKPQPKETQA